MTNRPEEDLAEVFAVIARELQAEADPERTYERVTSAALEVVKGCDHAAISLIKRGRSIDSVAATDEVPVRADRIQYEVGEGPCLEAITAHDSFLADDLASEDRWPRFSRRAAVETGVHSMLSFRLFVEDDTIGALNLYSRQIGAFDDQARAVGAILAAHAAVAMDAAREHERAEQVAQALQSNRRIGIAMGILMNRDLLTDEQAFELLRRASQYLNVKLRDLAEQVIETGDLPTDSS